MLKILSRRFTGAYVLRSKISRIIAGNIWCCQQSSGLINEERQDLSNDILEIPISVKFVGLKDNKDYVSTYTEIVRDIEQFDESLIHRKAKNRLIKALNYTVPYGKQHEGIGLVEAYKLMERPNNLTRENIKLAHVMGWCLAIQNACFIIDDDIIDGEETRKGFPCWHTLDNIGLTSINDSVLIDKCVFYILKKYFSQHCCYMPTIELFYEASFKLAAGQAIDTSSKENGMPKFKDFTRELHKYISDSKGAKYCYECSIRLAMYLAGIFDLELHKIISDISSKIGYLLVAHNDIQDVFGEPKIIGKRGTDIGNGRCSWLAVETLERGTPEQRRLFMEHYGKASAESQQIIKDLFRELNLLEVYYELEKKIIMSIDNDAEHISDRVPKMIFHTFLKDMTTYRKGYCYE